jgi:hypothetical protein
MLQARADALIQACRWEEHEWARMVWEMVQEEDWLSPSDRILAFRERLIAEAMGRPKDLRAVDLSLPGQRRPRKIVRRSLEGGYARAEFSDVQEFADG